jgi:hypothetical protein
LIVKKTSRMTRCRRIALTYTLLPLLTAQFAGAASTTYVSLSENRAVMGNRFLERGLDLGGQTVRTVYVENKLTHKRIPVESSEFVVRIDGTAELPQRDFRLTSPPSLFDVPCGKRLTCQLRHEKLNVTVKLFYELLDDDFYTRKWLEIALPPGPTLLKTVDIERLRLHGVSPLLAGPDPKRADQYQERLTVRLGQPVFAADFFLGVEYPAAENSVDPAGWITLRQYVGRALGRQTWTSKKAVIGVAPGVPLNRVADWFQKYVDRIRVAPVRRFIQWQSWWTTKTPTEAKTLLMIDKVKEEFLDKGVPLNVFLLDAHWQTNGWEVNPKAFPRGFEPIERRLQEIGLPLGLWMGLTQAGGTPQWLAAHGYETTKDPALPCFAAPRWGKHVARKLLGYVEDLDLACWKTDYTLYTCEKTDHGHLGGVYSVSAHADAMIDLQQAIRRIRPDFYAYDGFWMSPWWLMYVDAIWPDLTDFLVELEFPSTNARDSQITSRDAFIHRRLMTDKFQVPLHSIMTCEPIRAFPPNLFRKQDPSEAPPAEAPPFCGAEDPLDRWTNDIVMHYCRGTALTELYVSPWLLDHGYGDSLRGVMKWGIAHTDVLLPATRMILGDPRRLQVYGYAHFPAGSRHGIIGLRNPAFGRQCASVALDESAGMAKTPDEYIVQIVYPYLETLDRTFRYGDKVESLLNGYETLVLEVTAQKTLREPIPLGLSFRPVERAQGTIVYELLELPGSRRACRVVGKVTNTSARLAGRSVPLDEHARLNVTFPGEREQLTATRSVSPNELVVHIPSGYTNPMIAILCRGKGAENLELPITDNGQPMKLRAVKPNRGGYHVQPGRGWQILLGTLSAGDHCLHYTLPPLYYTLPPAADKISVTASVSAEVPLAGQRLEMSFPEEHGMPDNEPSLPLLSGDRRRQVVELNLAGARVVP